MRDTGKTGHVMALCTVVSLGFTLFAGCDDSMCVTAADNLIKNECMSQDGKETFVSQCRNAQQAAIDCGCPGAFQQAFSCVAGLGEGQCDWQMACGDQFDALGACTDPENCGGGQDGGVDGGDGGGGGDQGTADCTTTTDHAVEIGCIEPADRETEIANCQQMESTADQCGCGREFDDLLACMMTLGPNDCNSPDACASENQVFSTCMESCYP